MAAYDLDAVLDLLDRFRQRATYGAVGRLVDRPAAYLMGGRPRDPRHSWVVNAETLLPTGYTEEQMHPELVSRREVLASAEELDLWLRDPR